MKLRQLLYYVTSLMMSAGAFSINLPHLYIGGNIGAANLSDKESTPQPSAALHHLGANGLFGGGLIGYDFILNKSIKIGMEGFMNARALNSSSNQYYPNPNGISPTYNARMKYDLGFRALPTYALNSKNSLFVALGYASGKFNIEDNGNYGFISSNTYKSGFQYGGGIQTNVWQQIDLRINLLYTFYSSSNLTGLTVNNVGNPGTSSLIYTNQFSTLDASLAIVYQFQE